MSKKNRNDEEKKEAIRKLEENRASRKRQDQVNAINLMIKVINNEYDEDWIYDEFPLEDENGDEDFENFENQSTCISALEYLRGESEIEDLLYD